MKLIVFFTIILTTLSLTACSLFLKNKNDVTNKSNIETENTVKLIGRVQIYGNEPHTFVGIIDENNIEYAVYPPQQEKKLRPLQGHLIEFSVVFLNEPRGLGSSFLKGGTVKPIKWNIIR